MLRQCSSLESNLQRWCRRSQKDSCGESTVERMKVSGGGCGKGECRGRRGTGGVRVRVGKVGRRGRIEHGEERVCVTVVVVRVWRRVCGWRGG